MATAAVLLTGGSVAGVVANAVFGGSPDLAAAAADARLDAPKPVPAPDKADSRAAEAVAGVGELDAPVVETRRPVRPAVATRTSTATSKPAKLSGVAALQSALGVRPDGDFGKGTEAALKRWQKTHGLKADGVAGRETRVALDLGDGPALRRDRPARRKAGGAPRARLAGAEKPKGRRGGGVKALQSALGLPADGVFGPATERALKRWQRSHGIAADGIAGPQTRTKLGIGPGRVLKRKGGRRGGGRHGGGGNSSVVARVVAAGNRIASKPYRYGGGHGSFNDTGYDCSGSVSYALHGGGLLSAPLDSRGFMSYGRPGPGKHITIYANPGHVYMVVNGRRFDTSARRDSGSRWSGRMRSRGGYVVRHPAGY